jgi:hypothetical protein
MSAYSRLEESQDRSPHHFRASYVLRCLRGQRTDFYCSNVVNLLCSSMLSTTLFTRHHHVNTLLLHPVTPALGSLLPKLR